jgi:DinB superfamily
MSQHTIVPIEIPDASREPAAYVRSLVDTLGDRDPLEVYAATPASAADICHGLSDAQWHAPLAEGEWSAAQIVGHLFDVDIVYGFRWRLVLTEDKPAYPGYNEKLWSQLPRPDATGLLAAWSGIRAANVALLRGIPAADWKRWGTHGEQGDEQFDLMVDKIAGHDLAHLNQLARTVAAARER